MSPQQSSLVPGLAAAEERHGGLFTRAEALAAGYADGQISRFVHDGRWVKLRPGIYGQRSLLAIRGDDECATFELATSSAVLAVRGAVASHASAAVLIGMTSDFPRHVTVTRSSQASGRSRLADVEVHRAAMPAGHRTVVRAIPVTNAARTVIDLARSAPFCAAVAVADAALRLGSATADDLDRMLAECRQWPGICAARQVVKFADGRAESPLESIGRVVFAELGLPAPELQVRITLPNGLQARVDFLWRKYATIVETDGLAKYGSPDALRREKLRQEALAQLGFEVVRVTWQELHDDPANVAARIRRAFARGAAHIRANRAASRPDFGVRGAG